MKGNDRKSFLTREILEAGGFPRDEHVRAEEPPDDERWADHGRQEGQPASWRRRQDPGGHSRGNELVDQEKPEQRPARPIVRRGDQVFAAHFDCPIVKAERLKDVQLQIPDQEQPDRCERIESPGDHLVQEIKHDHAGRCIDVIDVFHDRPIIASGSRMDPFLCLKTTHRDRHLSGLPGQAVASCHRARGHRQPCPGSW